MSNKSKDILISAKNKKIEKLELENKYLKQELAKLRGKLYDNI
jgi:cell division protein FtsB